MTRFLRKLGGASRTKRGFTLTEMGIATALASIVLIVLWYMFHRGVSIQDATSKSIEIQIGARAFLENLVRDVNQGHRFMVVPSGDGEAFSGEGLQICVIRYRGTNARERVDKNIGGILVGQKLQTYPFLYVKSGIGDGGIEAYVSNDENKTKHVTPCYRCIYTWDKAKMTITRTFEEGFLEERNHQKDPFHLSDLTFRAAGEDKKVKKELASDVKELKVKHLTYRQPKERRTEGVPGDGNLVDVEKLEPKDFNFESWPIDEKTYKIQQTSCIAVHFKASFERGLYGKKPGASSWENQGKDRKAPQIEIYTKIWSYARLKDEIHKEHFSSMDDDLRY